MVVERSNALVYLITSSLELKVEGSNTRLSFHFRDFNFVINSLCEINLRYRSFDFLRGDKNAHAQPRLSVPIEIDLLGGLHCMT